ncbi:NapC/NirT family cytochrome c [Selenihalanaerobacter shriftii]|uniref:NapC/NirT cytochrome c family, N-terminal region n=1 Tax=Selenihalanaerobacter shriftii TaxID=142842 RepID=A0A1T4MIV8_9FIRM|nr:NapC/NirT family cytochrome c [Selenihalanaerobacter shriftii]SJZ66797.1 NapC/NirT cytochrome c family, N-terminal region [Selenihalanaerobacter shriftii]
MAIKDYLNWKVIVGVFILLIVFSVGAIEYTSTPQFCNSCHVMDEAYQTWENTTHKDVNCLKCHADSGIIGKVKVKIAGTRQLYQVVTNNVPEEIVAHVPDKRCIKCHKDIGQVSKVENIKIPHDSHMEKDLECVTCHEDVVHAESLKASKPSMDTCAKCHDVTDINNCAQCHSTD